jgi:hypothetical protein
LKLREINRLSNVLDSFDLLVEYWLRDFDFDLLNVELIVVTDVFLLLESRFLHVLLYDIALIFYRIVHLVKLIVAEENILFLFNNLESNR